jgi:hypothetical protein
VALKIGFNEGSLLRRTLLHVGTFVVGSVAFIGLMSFMLVTLAKGLVSAPGAASADESGEAAPAADTTGSKPKAKAPSRKKLGAPAATESPTKAD